MTSYDALYRENAELIYRYVFSLTQDADLAEELTQQTFFEALRHPDNFRGDSAVSTYLCGIAKNLLKREWTQRKKESHISLEDADVLPSEHCTETCVSESMERLTLFRRIHDLPEIMREVVYLRLAGELPFAEIGSILGKSENWTRVTFYRAKQKLMEGDDSLC